MATPGAFHERGFHPTAVCGIFGATAAAARLGGLTPAARRQRVRHRRQHGVGAVRVPRRRHGDEADPPRVGGARRTARRPAGRARRRGAAGRARGPLRRLPCVRRHADRPRAAARRPRRAVGDAADRVQAVPGLPLRPRLARRHGVAPCGPRSGRDRGRRRDGARGGRVPRARAGGVEGCAAHGLRGQVQPPVLDGRHARPRARWPRHVHARGARRPPRARPGAEGPVRDEGVRELPGRLPRRRVDPAARRAHARGRHAAPARRAREPDERGAGAREVPRERRAGRRRLRAVWRSSSWRSTRRRTCAGC